MKRRQKLGLLAALGVLTGSILPFSANAQEEKKAESLTWNQKIEQEIRKQDSWVEGYVQEDYTLTNRTSHVQLRIFPKEKQGMFKEIGSLLFSGAFGRATDELLLPEPLTEKQEKEVLDSVDHELFHGVFDPEGKKGLIHSPNYQGPSLEEITRFVERKTSEPEFLKLRERLSVAEEMENMRLIAHTFKSAVENQGMKAISAYTNTVAYIEGQKTLDKHLTERERKELESRQRAAFEEFQKYKDAAQTAFKGYEEIHRLLEGKNDEISLAEAKTIRGKIAELGKPFGKDTKLSDKVDEFQKYAREIYRRAEDKVHQEAVEAARKTGNTELIRFLEESRENANALNGMYDALERTSQIGGIMSGNLEGILRTVVSADNVYHINQILGNPDEVMARVVDSLYSLHYGEVEQNRFPLSKEDREFLGRFKINVNGKPVQMYRKGLEKYEVGEQMIADGLTPQQAKEALEYSTGVTYKGKVYSWPESRFTIKGKIPEWDFSSKEEKKE